MKLVLTKTELSEVMRRHYRAMDGHAVLEVTIQPYSNDFCTIELEEVKPGAKAEVVPLIHADMPVAS